MYVKIGKSTNGFSSAPSRRVIRLRTYPLVFSVTHGTSIQRNICCLDDVPFLRFALDIGREIFGCTLYRLNACRL